MRALSRVFERSDEFGRYLIFLLIALLFTLVLFETNFGQNTSELFQDHIAMSLFIAALITAALFWWCVELVPMAIDRFSSDTSPWADIARFMVLIVVTITILTFVTSAADLTPLQTAIRLFSGFSIGWVFAWYVASIARISTIARRASTLFDSTHHDGRGGLKPIREFFFEIQFVPVVVIVLLTLWGFFRPFDYAGIPIPSRIALAVASVLSIFCFVDPLWTMYRQSRELQPPAKQLAEPSGQKDVYVSYAWEDASNKIVEGLKPAVESEGFHLVRDKDAMQPGDRISDFMLKIAKADLIVVVLSGKYLRSLYCMRELYGIYQHSVGDETDFLNRILPVSLPDATYADWRVREAHEKYWRDECTEMEKSVPDLGRAQLEQLADMREWSNSVSTMLAYVGDKLQPLTLDDCSKDGYAAIRAMLRSRSAGSSAATSVG